MKTILLIDDDDACRHPTAEWLRRLDWNVFEAADGETGLTLALKHRPDVILCDLLMPRVNGYQVCRSVREHLELRHTKIIVVTGRDYSSDRKSAEEAGADDYLVKPVEFARLEIALQRVVPASDGTRPTVPAPEPTDGDAGTRLKFWGVRGSIPSPGSGTVIFGGNTSCIEVRAEGRIVVLDAGSGIRLLGVALMKEFGPRPIEVTLLITHTHWDHIQGFPFFVPAYLPKNNVRILGYEGAKAGLAMTLSGQMESQYFPIALDEMSGNIVIEEVQGMDFKIGTLRVEACFTNHPGVCVAYKLHTRDGTIVYMPDNETKRRCAPNANGGTMPDKVEDSIADFIRDVDVLIMDSQYTAEEYATHVNWGHSCVDEVVRVALEARVKRLFLFHHDPSHDDEFLAKMLVHAREVAATLGGGLAVDSAHEGVEVMLGAAVAAAAN
jgi:phosphoribosyl 1,2-cyclic phosphodiesterase/CheY-like chemotaxis protein